MASVGIAGSKSFAVQRGLICLRSLFPQLGAIGEADPQRGDCIGQGAGQMAEAVFTLDVDIGYGYPLSHVGF
ncbi:hypothetical protein BCh11DRAFT_00277 [Burkholderia sp. Ch1-1]|nr:hypothetical protein BCh11DRAFT_00277 [Burkholderia sp. Ch1-1]